MAEPDSKKKIRAKKKKLIIKFDDRNLLRSKLLGDMSQHSRKISFSTLQIYRVLGKEKMTKGCELN